MGFRETIAKKMAPDLMNKGQVDALIKGQVADLVKEEVQQAKMAMPISVNYDPKNEGFRRLTMDGNTDNRRDLTPIAQDMMHEIAYYMYDTSGLTKRFVRDTKNFILGEGVTWVVENDDKGAAKQVIDDFWHDSWNRLDLRLGKRIEFLCLLGEQCWPVDVNPHNGRVRLGYVDPSNIEDVYTVAHFPEMASGVKLKGHYGKSGKVISVVRHETDIYKEKEYGRLVGECFFFAVNNPPNGPRGRSDLIQSFDFINALEESIFNELERMQLMKNFIWDVTIEGATSEEIKDFLKNNKTPLPASVRAHNGRIKWDAVAPRLQQYESKAYFEFMRSYLAAINNRPDSWFGAGGKAYQKEADLMGEPTFKDLGDRQLFVKYMLEYVFRFVLDQAIIHKMIRENEKKPFTVTVNMPEMTTKDLKTIVSAMFTLAQSLTLAEQNGHITKETGAKIYASVASQTGIEVDAADEIKKAAKDPNMTEDYEKQEAFIDKIAARIEQRAKEPEGDEE